MNRRSLIILGVLIILGLGWFSLMGYINSRSANVHVTVAGEVDEVTFYEASRPDIEVARIVTNGEETLETLRLPNTTGYSFWRQMPPAAYYFITHQGEQFSRNGPVCCPVGLPSSTITLVIRSIDNWERSTE